MKLNRPTSDNRAYLTSVLRTFVQIQPIGWTSDTLEMLSERLKTNIEMDMAP